MANQAAKKKTISNSKKKQTFKIANDHLLSLEFSITRQHFPPNAISGNIKKERHQTPSNLIRYKLCNHTSPPKAQPNNLQQEKAIEHSLT
jgi:hypothetical protein